MRSFHSYWLIIGSTLLVIIFSIGAVLLLPQISLFHTTYTADWMVFGTYFGGSCDFQDKIHDVAVDHNNNIIVVGQTLCKHFPVKKAYDSTYNGNVDVFVSKFNPQGELIWSTFLGGSEDERALSVVVDSQDNIIVTGYTESPNFPVKAAYDSTFNSRSVDYSDVFISKFTTEGDLVWSTFLGGTKSEHARSVDVDSLNNIVIVGDTSSSDFPVKAAYDSTFNGGKEFSIIDVFVSKFSSDGALIWSTFLGGESNELGTAVVVDSNNNIIITGSTNSADFPVKAAYDQSLNINGNATKDDAFVSKFSSDGALTWSTFFGGESNELGTAIVVDSNDNIIVTGVTKSTNFPVKNAYDSTFNENTSQSDAFLSKFSTNGSLIWSTFLGGSKADVGADLAIDTEDHIVLVGGTISADFPLKNAYDPTYNDKSSESKGDAFVSSFNANGSLIWSSFLGGSQNDGWGFGWMYLSVAIDTENYVIVAGETFSPDFPVKNAYDSHFSGMSEGFIVKFQILN